MYPRSITDMCCCQLAAAVAHLLPVLTSSCLCFVAPKQGPDSGPKNGATILKLVAQLPNVWSQFWAHGICLLPSAKSALSCDRLHLPFMFSCAWCQDAGFTVYQQYIKSVVRPCIFTHPHIGFSTGQAQQRSTCTFEELGHCAKARCKNLHLWLLGRVGVPLLAAKAKDDWGMHPEIQCIKNVNMNPLIIRHGNWKSYICIYVYI